MDQAKIRARLESVATETAGLSADDARDVAFHLTDWLEDMAAFSAFLQNPSSLTAEEIDSMLSRFLIHVPNHLAAAAKIYADFPVTDVFGVGAISDGTT